MKKFLLISTIFLVISLILAVVAFYYVSFQLRSSQTATEPVVTLPAATTSGVQADVSSATTSSASPTSIPLRDLPINDSQQKVLETVGVEIDTFVITPAMQVCAAEKLGAERIAKIVSGDAPTALETARLVPCLGAE